MNSLGNKIFGEGAPLTPEELEAYNQGSLSGDELHALEQRMAADPLSAEAAEGFAAVPGSIAALGGLQEQFASQLANAPAAPQAGFWAANKALIIGGVGAAAIGTVLFFVLSGETNDTPVVDNTPAEQLNNQPTDDLYAMELETEDLTDAEIDSAKPIAEEEQITYEVALQNQPTTVEGDDEPIVNTPVIVLDTMNIDVPEINRDPVEPIPTNTDLEELPIEDKKIVHSNVAIEYFYDLKVVDYSSFYTTKIEVHKFDHSQSLEFVAAPFETAEQQAFNQENPDIVTEFIPYIQFLESTMAKFNKNKYNAACKDFRTILKYFPDDVNAHFYGGLCYFNLGKKQKAYEFFEKVLENSTNTFDQEAKWYMTLVLLKRRQYEKAEAFLVEIVNEEGFYAARAQEELDKLER